MIIPLFNDIEIKKKYKKFLENILKDIMKIKDNSEYMKKEIQDLIVKINNISRDIKEEE